MTFQLSGNAPENYENTMVPLWFRRWAVELLTLVQLKPGERLLDVACGTGVTTRMAHHDVGESGQVTGLDINEAMLAKARALSNSGDITWIKRDVVGTSLPSESFDAIISQHGFHYFPDQPAALKELLRLLAPSGRIALSIWDGHCVYSRALCNALEKFISTDVANVQRNQRNTPTAAELIDILSSAGFRNAKVVRQELDIKVPSAINFVPLHLGSMPIADAFDRLTDYKKTALIANVADQLEAYVVDDQMVYPDAVNVVMGVR